MDPDSQASEEFVIIGTYSVVDARRLLAALEAGSVDFRVQFRDGPADINPVAAVTGGAFGQAAQATISVAPAHQQAADKIHMDLFGDCLPNYEATYFREKGKVDDDATPNA